MPMRPLPKRPMPMHRRKLLAAGAAATLATAPLPTPAIAQGRVEWRMVTTWPTGFPGPGTAAVAPRALCAAGQRGQRGQRTRLTPPSTVSVVPTT